MNKSNDETLIKPYGDTMNDGIIQLSFTLPVEYGARATKAAELYLKKLNFEEVKISFSTKIADNFTYFVAYASAIPTLDYSQIVATEIKTKHFDMYQLNDIIKKKFNRKVVVVGATIGTDAHTVGIDAIMNMKGYNQDYGLERYQEAMPYNMGAQIPIEILLEKAIEVKADAILVSQTVTQKESDIKNFTSFIELLEAENERNNFLVLAGGPRMTHDLALELGYDAGFGPGTVPSQVMSFIVNKLLERKGDSIDE